MFQSNVDPSLSSVGETQAPSEAGGFFGFLDKLGDAAIGSLPAILDNVTQKSNDPAPVRVIHDQTRVGGDAALTQDKPNFLKDNWQIVALGAVALIGGAVYLKS